MYPLHGSGCLPNQCFRSVRFELYVILMEANVMFLCLFPAFLPLNVEHLEMENGEPIFAVIAKTRQRLYFTKRKFKIAVSDCPCRQNSS